MDSPMEGYAVFVAVQAPLLFLHMTCTHQYDFRATMIQKRVLHMQFYRAVYRLTHTEGAPLLTMVTMSILALEEVKQVTDYRIFSGGPRV